MNNRQELEDFLKELGFVHRGSGTFTHSNTYTIKLNYAANECFLMSVAFYDDLVLNDLVEINAKLTELYGKKYNIPKPTYQLSWRIDANPRLTAGQNLCYNDWKDKQVWLDNFKQLDWKI